METYEDIVLLLNELLNAEVLDNELLERSVDQFIELCKSKTFRNDKLTDSLDQIYQPGIVWMDFELYTEEKKEKARLEKVANVRKGNFEYAANMRDVEKDCRTYLQFKKHHGFKKSAFVLIQGFLIYTYFGTAKNDHLIKGFLTRKYGYKNLKIEYLAQGLKWWFLKS